MSVHTKKPLTEVKIGNESYQLPKKHLRLVRSLVQELSNIVSFEKDGVPAKSLLQSVYGDRPKNAVHLRAARKKENLSQAELSQRTGIAIPNISAYENGTRKMTKAVAKKMAKVLRISENLLMDPQDKKKK